MSSAKSDGNLSPALLDAMGQAFAAVWTTLYPHMPDDGDEAEQLKGKLRRTLVALAADGITDAQDLRRQALVSMALSR